MPAESAKPTFIAIAGLILGVSFGLSYGDSANHQVYLLSGLRLADPNFLAHDWLATQTFLPHQTFGWLVAALQWLGILPWSLAILNLACVALVVTLAYRLLGDVFRAQPLLAWLVFILIFIVIERTRTIGATTFFRSSLEPATISTIAMVAAIYFYVQRQFLVSGVLLAIGGMFHTNFLILSFPYFGLAHLLLGKEKICLRLVKQLAPCLAVLAGELQILLPMVAASDQEGLAKHILYDIFYKAHYAPLADTYKILDFYGWHLIAVGCLVPVLKSGRERTYLSVYGAFFIVVTVSVVVSHFIPHSPMTRMFTWRLAPFSLFFSSLVVAAAVADTLAGRHRIDLRPLGLCRIALMIGGAIMVVRSATYYSDWTHPKVLLIAALFIGFGGFLYRNSVRRLRPETQPATGIRFHAPISMALAAITVAGLLGTMAQLPKSFFSLVLDDAVAVEKRLYGWAKGTAPDSQFLIPPGLSGFRIFTGRAVVADLANPILADHLVAWYRRLEEISGHSGFEAEDELFRGYKAMTLERLERLRRLYGVDYAIFGTPFEALRFGRPIAYRDESYVVLDLR